ncbi:MAG: hypothetical protein GY861_11530 [bacterium]|nr:hypothetical protein [bacterium]
MEKINWSKVYKLSPGEFSEDPNEFAEPSLIYSLSDVRKLTDNRMFPSPVEGSLARQGGTSQHSITENKKKSKASDVFMEGVPIYNYSLILASGRFNGIGIYIDTTGPDGLPWVMFHLDIRSRGFRTNVPWVWIVKKEYDNTTEEIVNNYMYPQKDPQLWRELYDYKMYQHVLKR